MKESNMSPESLWIVASTASPDVRGGNWSRVDASALRANFQALLAGIGSLLQNVDDKISSFSLDEITLSIEVTASGQLGILGTGATAGGTSGFELKLTRKK